MTKAEKEEMQREVYVEIRTGTGCAMLCLVILGVLLCCLAL
jgi:hypothetical protein